MRLYHVTTEKKLARYRSNRIPQILPPVRGFSTEAAAWYWARRTGRSIVLRVETPDAVTYKLPDHHNRHGCAYWCDRAVPLEVA